MPPCLAAAALLVARLAGHVVAIGAVPAWAGACFAATFWVARGWIKKNG